MKKQVILIMTDTTCKEMLGCYGDKRMHTPNLDALAAEGIRYENAYTCQPVCGPARSAIFTGLFPHENGMIANGASLGADVKTIGQRLTNCGISCGYIGKWHLDGGDYFGLGTCPDGWDADYWYDMKNYLEELNLSERVRSRQSSEAFSPDFTEEFTYAHRCTDRAIRYLEQHDRQDFFLTVSYDEPHAPSLCPSPYNTMYADFKFDPSPRFTDELKDKPLMQRLWAGSYLNVPESSLRNPSDALTLLFGCNSFVDYEIGRILELVRSRFPDALVLFTSDHGDMLGAHRLYSKNAAVYREVANVPLIISGGEKGKVVNAPASHIDIVPTILDYFGIPVPKQLSGCSMLPQIYDAGKTIHEAVFMEFTRYETDHDGFGGLQLMRAVISEHYKLAIHLLDQDEFYDLTTDPCETKNRIQDPSYLPVIKAHHRLLIRHMNDTRDPYRGYQWSARPWNREFTPCWDNEGYTRQREPDGYEPVQLDYDTGLPITCAVRKKYLYEMEEQSYGPDEI